MKKYFLHNGIESSGPFSFEELVIKKIGPKTPVWFDGMEKWKYAIDIPELHSLFRVMPPPLQTLETKTKNNIAVETEENEDTNQTYFGLPKNVFLIVSGIVVLALFTLIFNFFQEQRAKDLEAKNRKTEQENAQYILQQKEIEEQKILLENQKILEEQRLATEKKQKLNNRLIEIDEEKAIAKENLKQAKQKLLKANEFKLLRTQAEKNEELASIENEIAMLEKQIQSLNKEAEFLYLELEKIK